MSKEILEFEKVEERERPDLSKETINIADDSVVGIENGWDALMNGLGSDDYTYQVIQEELDKTASWRSEALFKMARATNGVERLKYAEALRHLLQMIKSDQTDEILKNMLTTREAIDELMRKAKEEAGIKEKGTIRKAISYLRGK